MCEELGFEVETYEAEPGRPNVIARWSGGVGPTVTYCSHIDVVPAGDPSLWERDPYGAEIADGRLHGRGSGDAKGPIACALEAAACLRATGWEPQGTLELALVSDEETMGFKGAGWLVDQGIVKPDVAIVGEPTRVRVVRAQRGASWYRLTTHGLAAHGSAPERGVSAIRHMAEVVRRLDETLPDAQHELLGGPSLSVGVISGGTKTNIVPASCWIEIDRRTVPQETEPDVRRSIEAAIEAARDTFPDIDARVELLFYSQPFEMSEDSRIVSEVAAAVTEASGADAQIIGFRGASDARFLTAVGAEVVVLGPGEIELAHTARESLDLSELEPATIAYALSFAALMEPPA